MKELLTTIVKNLVDDEEGIQITEITDQEHGVTLLDVSAKKEDVGKILGKQGNTAKAIRTLLKASAKKRNKRYTLNIH